MLEFLLNVSPARLYGARVEWLWSPLVLALVAAAAVAVALWLGGYLGRDPGQRRQRLPALARAGIALLLALVLARPTVVVRAPDAAAGPVVVLLDESLSMSVADGPGGVTRGAWMDAAFAPGGGPLLAGLEARFQTRVMRYAGRVGAAGEAGAGFEGVVSDALGALQDTVGVDGNGLAGVVLVSDGGQLPGADVTGALTRLAAARVPVHVVAVGSAAPGPDLAIAALSAPESVLAGDTVDVRVGVTARGLDTRPVTLSVRDNGVLVGERVIGVAGNPGRATETIAVRLDEPGLRQLQVRAERGAPDLVPGNDVAHRLVEVRAGPVRVLHVEGEPRFEVKFLRRALSGDTAVAVSSLVRTGDNRYLRLGIEHEAELAGGFPDTAEALFPFQVLVLGSIEAGAFSSAQLALLEDYVSRRGGSVLLLGGRYSLAEGGYGDTPLARLLPVYLEPPVPDFVVAAHAGLTPAGRAHPATRGLDGAARALPLPALAVVNPVRRLKPGASVLLEGTDSASAGDPPLALLSHHRYGRGRVAVLAVRDSWRWRMHGDVAPEDRSHELFWRRLLRWLARDVPGRVEVRVSPRVVAPGQDVSVRARLHDAAWREQPGAEARVVRTTPLGDKHRRPLVYVPGAGGAHAATVTPLEAGGHELQVIGTLVDGGEVSGSAAVLVTEHGEEFRSVALDESLLRRIAERSGGSYRHADAAHGLAERVAATAPPGENFRRIALWNAPALLLALLVLACGEWWLRRRRKLA